MKTLMTSIQTALRASAGLSYLRKDDAYISPTVNYMPDLIRSVGIGIVPGPQGRVEKLGGRMDVTRTVRIAVFVNLLKPDSAVIGIGSNKGLLDVCDDIDAVLNANFLGLPAIESAFCRSISEPVVFGSEAERGRMIVRIVMDYQYESEESEP